MPEQFPDQNPQGPSSPSSNKEELAGARLLHSKYSDLQKSPVVERSVEQRRHNKESIPNEPSPRIEAWLQDLERTHTGLGASPERQEAQPQVLERIKESYHRTYITGTDDGSVGRKLHHEAQIAQNQGHGLAEDIMQRVNHEVIEQTRQTIRQDQEQSLDRWIDYLTSDDASYPMWFKYYLFRNITKLAQFDKEAGEFPKRSKSTTAPFPDINREALAYMEDSLAKHYGLKQLDPHHPEAEIDPAMKELLDKDSNFASLYKRTIDYAAPKTAENLAVTDGEWVKFDQTDDPEQAKELAHSLHGYGTGWCTAGEGMAASQLSAGDFYVYYSKSEDGKYTVPRVAIRMKGRSIGEVRGIEADQNMEGPLVPIAEAKMNEVDPQGAEPYKKKSADMQKLTAIYTRHTTSVELTNQDLRFLYELDGTIQGFGYQRDPRIEQILADRNKKADLSLVLGIDEAKISITAAEALSGDILYHHGNLRLYGLTSTEGLTLPTTIGGDLTLPSLTSAEGLTLPNSIGGGLDLRSLTSAEGLTLPTAIGGSLSLNNLTSAEGLTPPTTINGYLWLSSLTNAEGLTLPTTIGDYLVLSSLTSAEGLTLPNSIGGGLFLDGLISAEGLTLPTTIGGDLGLGSLTSVDKQALRDKYPQLASKII